MTETALRKGRELIAIPGTSENGNRRTGREDARASEKQLRIMDFKENEANSLESTSMGVSWVTDDSCRRFINKNL